MVTYSELFAYTLVIIGIVGLMLQIANKKMTAPQPRCRSFFD